MLIMIIIIINNIFHHFLSKKNHKKCLFIYLICHDFTDVSFAIYIYISFQCSEVKMSDGD